MPWVAILQRSGDGVGQRRGIARRDKVGRVGPEDSGMPPTSVGDDRDARGACFKHDIGQRSAREGTTRARPSANAVRAGFAPTKRTSAPSSCAATAASNAAVGPSPTMVAVTCGRPGQQCDRFDQHVDALELRNSPTKTRSVASGAAMTGRNSASATPLCTTRTSASLGVPTLAAKMSRP